MNPNDPFIKTYRLRLQQISNVVKNNFAKLRDDQLNWKPAENAWSVAQCLKHLLLASSGYIAGLEKVIAQAQQEHIPVKRYKPSLSGKLMFFLVDPTIRIWVPAPPSFKPSPQAYFSAEIVEQYIGLLKKISVLMEASRELNWNHYKVSSPVTSLIRLNIGDVFELLTLHGLRHLKQAQKVMSNEKFPH
jgi:hypothetical protein